MSKRKDASKFTKVTNKKVFDDPVLQWDDQEDWEDAQRGFIAKLEDPVIRNNDGRPVWDLNAFAFLSKEQAPPTANPSLWRQARLNMLHGLFQIHERIYQVRGYDLSVISFIVGDSGYIIVDPLISEETAKAALELVYQHVGKKPIKAVIYTHSHVDHWGGVKGIVSEEDVQSGKTKIIASEGFMHYAISENLLAGNAMSRRVSYMYGSILPKDEKGVIDAGLGKTVSIGAVGLIAPTDIISETGTKMTIDGVDLVFQFTPGTEAPTEINFYLPQFKALCMAENCSHNLHNLYTLRGAEVRDALAWAHYIDEAITLFAYESELCFMSHHWPVWGKNKILTFLKKQRDVYKYIHDEVLRLANHGYTMLEIAEMLVLPKSLAEAWYNRGYYGSVNHDAKAVYQKYLGFFDGNPASLHKLPPVDASIRYVEFMGGADAVLRKAKKYFDKGEYRWVAQVVNHIVFADPKNQAARELQADALEQLGYQAESSLWRNCYLAGAKELREGVQDLPVAKTASPDVIKATTIGQFFDYLAVRLNGPKAEGVEITINVDFTDTKEQYVLVLENAVLNHKKGELDSKADVTLTLTRTHLNSVILQETTIDELVKSNQIKLEGNPKKLAELISLLDDFEFWFNIVTP